MSADYVKVKPGRYVLVYKDKESLDDAWISECTLCSQVMTDFGIYDFSTWTEAMEDAVYHAERCDIIKLAQARDQLQLEYDGSFNLVMKSGKLLEGVAHALKGEPPALTSWSYHDLPRAAAEVVKERNKLREDLALAKEDLGVLLRRYGILKQELAFKDAYYQRFEE